MKGRYLAIAALQLAFIVISAVLRRQTWAEIDFSEGVRPMSLTARLASGFLFAWLTAIFIAAFAAFRDPRNRTLIILSLILLLPFFEFLGWLIASF